MAQYAFFMVSYQLNPMTIYRVKRYATLRDLEILFSVHYVIGHVIIKNYMIHAYFLELLICLTILQLYSLQYLCLFGVNYRIKSIQFAKLWFVSIHFVFDFSYNISGDVETKAGDNRLGMGFTKYRRGWRKSARIRYDSYELPHESGDQGKRTIYPNVDQSISLFCDSQCCYSNGKISLKFSINFHL